MRSVFVVAGSLLITLWLLASLAFGQGANGTITGTVTDPTGLAVAGANVEARNIETGVVYTGASTSAGNYAITNLPVGTYELTVKVSGFKTYTHTNLAMAAAQVLKEDIPLEVGATTESITVEAQAIAAEDRNRRAGRQRHGRANGRFSFAGHRDRQLRHVRRTQPLQCAPNPSRCDRL